MLTYTMLHPGSLGINPQKVIGALLLMHGDGTYNFMSNAFWCAAPSSDSLKEGYQAIKLGRID